MSTITYSIPGKTQIDLAGQRPLKYIVGMIRENFKESKMIIYAPLAGISDSPSRKIAVRYGADMTISELISSEGAVRSSYRTLRLARFDDSERPIGIQIFGANPGIMAKAARILSSDYKPDFIDINFGCPARKVVGKNGGSSILQDLKLLKEIVYNVVNAVDIPVTVKMRSGWDNQKLTYLEAGKIVEDCGVAAVTLHSRTRMQKFSGEADWSQIAELKQSLNIPVIGNGDIKEVSDVVKMFDYTGCDGIMIGRASIGNPWIFKRAKEFLKTGKIPPQPTASEKIELALEHFEMSVEEFGAPNGVYKMRSRFIWYLKGLPGASNVRSKINQSLSIEEIKDLLFAYKENLTAQDTPINTIEVT